MNLGGEEQKVEADINQFAGTVTQNRLVFTVGKFGYRRYFRHQQIRQQSQERLPELGADQRGHIRLRRRRLGLLTARRRNGIRVAGPCAEAFSTSRPMPAGGALNGPAYGLDPNLSQFQAVGEIEERHEFLGQPGKLKVTGFLSRGRMGNFRTP